MVSHQNLTICCFVLALLCGLVVSVHAGEPQPQSKHAVLHGEIFPEAQSRFELKRQALKNVPTTSHRSLAGNNLNYLVQTQSDVQSKSRSRAFLQSLILPGWGQRYAGSRTMMKVFIVSEVLTWGSFFGFRTWSNWIEDDFQTFARSHAGANPDGKPDRFFVDIGNFNSLEEYNQAQLRDRDVADLYPTDTNEFFWRWDSDANRREFEDMRIRSDQADNRANFALAAVFVNHIVSAIHSTLAVYQFNKRLQAKGIGYDLQFDSHDGRRLVKLTVAKRF